MEREPSNNALFDLAAFSSRLRHITGKDCRTEICESLLELRNPTASSVNGILQTGNQKSPRSRQIVLKGNMAREISDAVREFQSRSLHLEVPVRLVFGYHETEEDAAAAGRALKNELAVISKDCPIHLWLEDAGTGCIPKMIFDNEDILRQTHPAFWRERVPIPNVDWFHELLRQPSPPASSFLRQLFEFGKTLSQSALPRSRSALRTMVEELRSAREAGQPFDAFTLRQSEEILQLFHEKWKIKLEFEDPPFEAYLSSLQCKTLTMYTEALLRRDLDLAIEGVFRSQIKEHETLLMRDAPLAKRIVESSAENGGELHLVWRGIAHQDALIGLLNGSPVRAAVQWSQSAADRRASTGSHWLAEMGPPVELSEMLSSPQWRRAAMRKLLQFALLELCDHEQVSALSASLPARIEQLTGEQLAEVLGGYPEVPDNLKARREYFMRGLSAIAKQGVLEAIWT